MVVVGKHFTFLAPRSASTKSEFSGRIDWLEAPQGSKSVASMPSKTLNRPPRNSTRMSLRDRDMSPWIAHVRFEL